jgi:hypothetical protein
MYEARKYFLTNAFTGSIKKPDALQPHPALT